MRKQYYFWARFESSTNRGVADDEKPTRRSMLSHIRLMDEADLSYPIILSASGAVMDGMHRVAKAVRLGCADIEAVQFDADPEPDHLGLGPADLPGGTSVPTRSRV